MPSPVSRKLFRLLLRVRCEYRHAQIPLVGVVGFNAPPELDVRSQLLAAFRERQGASDAAELARRSSEGFRALRQAQLQLSLLQGSEEETREVRVRAAPPAHQSAAETAAAAARAVPAQLRQLAAALEEGSLLVERLYDANHLSLEFGDEEEGQEEEQAVGAGAGAGAGPGSEAATGLQEAAAAAARAEVAAEGRGLPAPTHLPAALLAPTPLAARRRLDGLAAAVAAAHPGLFTDAAATGSSSSSGSASGLAPEAGGGGSVAAAGAAETLLRRQLAAVSHTLFYELKFRHEPVEWVYDGLAPALLPQVITRRRGVPLSLAVLYCAVCRRLGLAAVPIKAGSGGAPGVAEGPAALHGLPPDVAARQAGRTVALAPSPDCWLVAAVAAPAATSATAATSAATASGMELVLVDVDRRGRLMTPAEAAARFPDLHTTQSAQHSSQTRAQRAQEVVESAESAALLPLLAAAAGSGPLPLWGELARLVLTAHTRRGESDLVAHWLVQVLALDHRAPEWAVMAPPA
eukprot:XP_001699815.1 predicted protein [Chlamydomonas reinhardtii]